MKVAILGAPGVGKTKLANELADLLDEWADEPFAIVDDYVEDLRVLTGLEYGGFGNFIDDMQVVFKRREQELDRRRMNTITVGTVLDSAVQNFVRVEEAAKNNKELSIVTERLKAIAATFGLLYTETWDYDYAFLLRSDDAIGRGLVDLLSSYRAPVFSFQPGVPDDEKAQVAFKAIKSLESPEPQEAEERGVRGGEPDGEDDGDSPEPVPDVPEPRGTPDDA